MNEEELKENKKNLDWDLIIWGFLPVYLLVFVMGFMLIMIYLGV